MYFNLLSNFIFNLDRFVKIFYSSESIFNNMYTLITLMNTKLGGNHKRPKSKFAFWSIGVVLRG